MTRESAVFAQVFFSVGGGNDFLRKIAVVKNKTCKIDPKKYIHRL